MKPRGYVGFAAVVTDEQGNGHCHVEVFYFEMGEILETRGQQFRWLSSLARRTKRSLLGQCDNAGGTLQMNF